MPVDPGLATTRSLVAADVACELWSRVAADGGTPGDVGQAAERLCAALRAGLGRWIGADGYLSLLDRALALARPAHPALEGLPCLGENGTALADAVRTHGAEAVADGMEALVASLIELLGRIVGTEMAVRLVEQVGVPGPRSLMGNGMERGHDG
jgi:hypothetical protein